MNRIVIGVGAACVGAAIAAGSAYLGWMPGLERRGDAGPPQQTASGSDDRKPSAAFEKVVALARLEPAGGIIDLGGMPGDRVEKLSARAGQLVRRDAALLTLESRKLRQLELDAAKAQQTEATERVKAERTYADKVIEQAQLGVEVAALDDLEVASQEERIKSLDIQAQTARRNYDRAAKLSADVTSEQQLDQLRLLRDQAANELLAAQSQLKKLKAGRDLRRREAEAKLAEAQAARAKIDAALPEQSLAKAVAAAEEKLKLATLASPIDGVVLEVLCDEGDVVGQMPLVRLGDVSKMVAVAEVYETQVSAVRVGQRAEITADALPASLIGRVERVSTVVGKNRMFSLDPTRNTDLRVVEVRIAIDDPGPAAQFVNLQATAVIRTAAAP